MKKILSNKVATLAILFVTMLSVSAIFGSSALAQIDPWNSGGNPDAVSEIGLGTESPVTVATNIIQIILGFLGMIAVVIILLGGFKWMTAAGNEDKISEAKKLLAAGLIGLIIILMAYGLATFVIAQLMGATDTGA